MSAHATSRPTINTTTGTQHRAASKQAFTTNAVKLDYPFLSVVHIFLLGEHFWLIITLYYSPTILLVLTKAHTSDRPFIGALHQVRFITGSRYMQFTMTISFSSIANFFSGKLKLVIECAENAMQLNRLISFFVRRHCRSCQSSSTT